MQDITAFMAVVGLYVVPLLLARQIAGWCFRDETPTTRMSLSPLLAVATYFLLLWLTQRWEVGALGLQLGAAALAAGWLVPWKYTGHKGD